MPHSRRLGQADLVSESILDTPITIVGAGAIGSFTTLALAKCGFHKLTVYDYDRIEEHNISNQFYPLDEVGTSKVEALLDMIKVFEGIEISGIEGAYPQACIDPPRGIVISAVDSMQARKDIFKSINRNKDVIAFVDGRMGGQQIEVYTVGNKNGEEKKAYRKCLWSDDEAENIRCTEKSVIYNVLLIAGMIVNQCRLVLEDKPYRRTILTNLERMQVVTTKLDDEA